MLDYSEQTWNRPKLVAGNVPVQPEPAVAETVNAPDVAGTLMVYVIAPLCEPEVTCVVPGKVPVHARLHTAAAENGVLVPSATRFPAASLTVTVTTAASP